LRTKNKTTIDGDHPLDIALNDAYQSLEGVEIIVQRHKYYPEQFIIVGWKGIDRELLRDYCYQSEQCATLGKYRGQRELFLKDWNEGNYTVVDNITLFEDEIELKCEK